MTVFALEWATLGALLFLATSTMLAPCGNRIPKSLRPTLSAGDSGSGSLHSPSKCCNLFGAHSSPRTWPIGHMTPSPDRATIPKRSRKRSMGERLGLAQSRSRLMQGRQFRHPFPCFST